MSVARVKGENVVGVVTGLRHAARAYYLKSRLTHQPLRVMMMRET